MTARALTLLAFAAFNLGAAESPIHASFTPTRAAGVAPLAVFFDATATSAPASTALPFHELHYAWDFGDPAGGARWESTGASKNAAFGPMAAHVFEGPGTYVVTLTVRHGASQATARHEIVVRDPQAFYLAAQTTCLANAAAPDWSGCPPGATQIAHSQDFGAAVRAHLGPHRRLLFRRGDTWSASAATLNVNGPWTIGAFGAGPKPKVRYASGQAMLLVGEPGATRNDGRVMDLQFDGFGAVAARCMSGEGTFNNLLLLRLDCADAGHGIQLDALNARPVSVWSGVAIVDTHVSRIHGPGGNAYFVTGEKFAVLGSSGSDSRGAGEHIFRSMYLRKAVLADNMFARPNATKHSLALRAPNWTTTYGNAIPARTQTEFVLISGNRLVGGPGVAFELEVATSDGNDERVRNLIVERNWFVSGAGGFAAAWINTSASSYRNNIFDMSASAARANNCILFDRVPAGRPPPQANWIYHNTCYSSAAAENFRGVVITAGTLDTIVKNNLAYGPNARNTYVVADQGSNTHQAGNSPDAKTEPHFAAQPPRAPADFKPTRGYALGGATLVPVWADFLGAPYGARRDIGALGH